MGIDRQARGTAVAAWERLGNAVRDRRHAMGWTQRELAQNAGVSYSAVRLVESGTEHTKWPRTLTAIVEALDWTVDGARALLVAAPAVAGHPVAASDVPTMQDQLLALEDRLNEAMTALARLARVLTERPESDLAWRAAMQIPVVLEGFRTAQQATGAVSDADRWATMMHDVEVAVATVAARRFGVQPE